MLRSLTILILLTGVLVTVQFAARAEGESSAASPPDFQTALSDYTPDTIRSFRDFALYSVGTQFDHLPLTYITRTFEKPRLSAVGGAAFNLPDNRTNYVNFIYGTCVGTLSAGGCAPPLTIQVWPACDATLADFYYNSPDGRPSREYELFSVRGVPAARFDGFVQIYSGRVTIVIFGDTEDLRMRAAHRLVAANGAAGGVSAADQLPPPVAGAMEGKLKC